MSAENDKSDSAWSRDLPVPPERDREVAAPVETDDARNSPSSSSATLWIGVGVVFALMAMAWTAMFFFASKHRPADVPLPAGETGAR